MIMHVGRFLEPRMVIEEVTDPIEIERHRRHCEMADRNQAWLQAHWSESLPQALGKHLAVAGQEAFIADDPGESLARARAAHPDDTGILIQYVRPERGPRRPGMPTR